MVRSAPVKSALMATTSVESPIWIPSAFWTADSCAAAGEAMLDARTAATSHADVLVRRMSDISRARDRITIAWGDEEVEGEPQCDGEDKYGEQGTKLLAAQLLPGAGAILRAGNAADHERDSEHDVDRMVQRGLCDR